jgi:hypothetical protein
MTASIVLLDGRMVRVLPFIKIFLNFGGMFEVIGAVLHDV